MIESDTLTDEQQRLLRDLIKREKLAGMGRLVTTLAHELNNPLQALQNTLHLLRSRPVDEEKRERYLIMAQEEVARLVGIVQRMLDFYRPAPETMRPIAVQEVLESVVELVDTQARQAGVEVVVEWSRLPRVAGAGTQLRQLFASLMSNAIEAMSDGGLLRISGRVELEGDPPRRVVVVDVSDTGPGIAQEAMHAIFEPFYTTKNNRVGLGLAVCYSIVEQHGGTLTVRADEGGTTFRVTLPALGPAQSESLDDALQYHEEDDHDH